ncbi:hypothetical protein J5Y04_31350 [Kitasatospora sp. RG8]|uniref:hypothetical protein n=1 Tax=Kitasatospora sp. RG8 TaxID=2820815 RepID=UPI001ADF1424|nr:hypothetical protein [Kitasatospora sp. RG8]MBP0454005.1 hypothetical protein [Kitasatospora sp. RG8]
MSDATGIDSLDHQINQEFELVAWRLELLTGDQGFADAVRFSLSQASVRYAVQLRSDDDATMGGAVLDLVTNLYPDDAPIPDDWWDTPLGRATAASTGQPTAESVTYSVAGAMLGIDAEAVELLARTCQLDGHPDGGVTSLSVQQYLQAHPRP